MARVKVLISAFACRPGEGSEPGVGWACAVAAAKHHDVWVLTRGRYRDLIEQTLAKSAIPNLRFVYLDLPQWYLRRTRPGHSFQFFYYFWQLMAYFVARRVCREEGIQVVHHVTYVKYWAPSFLSMLPQPFIWGPVGGGESTPPGFGAAYSLRGRAYELARNIARWIGEHDPFVRLTARRSAAALAATEDTARRMRTLGPTNVQVYPAIGLTRRDLEELNSVPTAEGADIRFISIGRLLHWKGFDLGVEAFARAGIAGAEYWIVGDGPQRTDLEALVRQRGLSDQVVFWGRLGRDETLGKLGECQVLVHPSLHDSGGLVCLEAMAARRPVICLDLGGPGVLLTEESGIKVAARRPAQVITELAEAMASLARDPGRRADMGAAGRRQAESRYLWEKKISRYAALYERMATLGQGQ